MKEINFPYLNALFIGVYIFFAILVAIMIWTDRKFTKLKAWEALGWIIIAIFVPFFLGVPLYFFYRSKKWL
ncbi:MAG: hypothetical protein AB1426_08325 [Bacillota bacterium]